MAQEINDNRDTVDQVVTNNEAAPRNGGTRITHSTACSPCCGTGGLLSSLFGNSSSNPATTTSTTSPGTVTSAPGPVNVPRPGTFSQPDIRLKTFSSSANENTNVASASSNSAQGSRSEDMRQEPTLVEIDTGEVLERLEDPTSTEEFIERRFVEASEYMTSSLASYRQERQEGRIALQEAMHSIDEQIDEAFRLLGITPPPRDQTDSAKR